SHLRHVQPEYDMRDIHADLPHARHIGGRAARAPQFLSADAEKGCHDIHDAFATFDGPLFRHGAETAAATVVFRISGVVGALALHLSAHRSHEIAPPEKRNKFLIREGATNVNKERT